MANPRPQNQVSNTPQNTRLPLTTSSSPIQNLSDPSLPYTSCVVIPNGVPISSSKAQQDDGTCSSVFSADCLSELTAYINSTAHSFTGIDQTNSSPCSELLENVSGSSSSKCKGE